MLSHLARQRRSCRKSLNVRSMNAHRAGDGCPHCGTALERSRQAVGRRQECHYEPTGCGDSRVGWWPAISALNQFLIKRVGLVRGAYALPEKELFEILKGSGDQSKPTRKREFMAIFLAILEFVFGCHHVHLSRVFTLQGETYKVCCDCGTKFAYSLQTMSIGRRLPLASISTRFRMA